MAFAASDSLSELVWSPRNGLSLKCTNSSVTDKKPFLLWDVGPSSDILSPSQSIRSKGSGDGNAIDQGNLTISHVVVDANDIFGDKAALISASRSPRPKLSARHIYGRLDTVADGINDCQVGTTNNGPFSTELIKNSQCSQNNNIEINASSSDALGLQHVANNSPPVERSPTNNSSWIRLYQEKGKERALSDCDIIARSFNDEDESHDSTESCNSAAFFSKGTKRHSAEEGWITGNKRIKNQIHESPDSTSIVRHDSSFMTWISNMVKGLYSSNNKEDSSSSLALTLACSYDVNGKHPEENFTCKKTRDSVGPNVGFQTIFQSLSCRNTTLPNNNEVQKEIDSTDEARELSVADKTSHENLPGSCERNNDDSCKEIGLCNKEVNPIIVGQPSKSMSDVPEKSNSLSSFWITRLSSRNPRLENCDEITREINGCSNHRLKVNLDSVLDDVLPIDQKNPNGIRDNTDECQVYASEKEITTNGVVSVEFKSTSQLCPIIPSQKIESSAAIADVFARRLDALRHITPSTVRNASTCSPTCFFCGNGHDLRECPVVTKSELEDLMLKMSSFDGVEESSFLCIRCFQLDHWAISCPLVPQKASFFSRYTACRSQFCDVDEKCSTSHEGEEDNKVVAADKPFLGSFPSYQSWNVEKYFSKRASTSNELRRSTSSGSANDVKDNQIVIARNIVALPEVFQAIRKLRLSRADILRWMNSEVSLSHLNGFFLRLRLGKVEAGLGEANYYVACITGDSREHNGCRSKKSILVDVGGIRSSVGSQYVSNHDFLEDEIKAWWCRIVDSGCRIPSLDELNSKLNDGKILGFS